MDNAMKARILQAQKNEITEHLVYKKLAGVVKEQKNRQVLEKIADDELKHYEFWKKQTSEDVNANTFKVWLIYLLARILGFTFAVKLMEKAEEAAQVDYGKIAETIEGAKDIEADENQHEKKLLSMLDEKRLRYAGSMVLGLNDALVELTGVLAGLTLALRNTRLIAMTGLVTGIAAALSMAASEYLSTKTEGKGKDPVAAAVYTGFAYLFTVAILIIPFLVFDWLPVCMLFTLLAALLVIMMFTFYISIAKDVPFWRRFAEMAALSMGVAVVSFLVGFVVRAVFNVEM